MKCLVAMLLLLGMASTADAGRWFVRVRAPHVDVAVQKETAHQKGPVQKETAHQKGAVQKGDCVVDECCPRHYRRFVFVRRCYCCH